MSATMAELPSINCSSISSTYESSSGSDGSYPSRRNKVEGYDYEFVPTPDARYECTICLLVLREPRQTPCGHRFCRDCIIKWIRESQQRCPVDNEPFEEKDLFADNFAKREIQNFNVKCPNSKQGCDTITSVKQLQAHQRECPFGLAPCPNRCSNVLFKRDLAEHVQHLCELRNVQCPNCGATFLSRDAWTHVEVCPKRQVKCHFCEEEMEMQAMAEHEATVCPRKTLHCAFHTLGCNAEMERCNEKTHLQDNLQEHMLLLCNGLTTIMHVLGIQRLSPESSTSTTRGLVPTETSGLLSGLALSLQQLSLGKLPRMSLDSQSAQLKQQLPRLPVPGSSFVDSHAQTHEESAGPISFYRSPSDPKNSLMGSAVSIGTQEASVLSHTSGHSNSSGVGGFQSLPSASSEDFESLKARNVTQDASLAMHDQCLIELQAKAKRCDQLNQELKQKVKQLEAQISDFESRVCSGQFFWRIRNYSKLLRDAEHGAMTALHSQPFYTSASMGYKICIRANLNGVDSAKGSHLSLFVHFMQGEYDDLLDWPFSGKIILSVIDQNERCDMRHHVSETLVAKPNLAAFQKPSTPRNHKGFGYMEFLPLSSVKGSSFIRNDTLIIKAQVLPNC